jgi:hypothetical protein
LVLERLLPPAVTQIRDLIEEGRREPDEARSTETEETDARQGAGVGSEGRSRWKIVE